MKNETIITTTLSVVIVHFLLSSLIGHYIALHVGAQVGQLVAGGLMATDSADGNTPEEEAAKIYENMKGKADSIVESWEIPRLLLSLPVKPLLTPFLNEVKRDQIRKVIAKEMTKDQLYTRGIAADYIANALNSLSLGMIIYVILKMVRREKQSS